MKIQTQKTTARDFSHPQKPITQDPKSVLLHNNIVESAKKKDKQKKLKHERDCTKKPKKIPATSNNTVDTTKKKKKHNISKIMYFNCNEKSYYINNCTKLKN